MGGNTKRATSQRVGVAAQFFDLAVTEYGVVMRALHFLLFVTRGVRSSGGAFSETRVAIAAGFVEQNPQSSQKHLAHYVVFPDGHFVVQRKHRVTYSEQPLEPCFAQLPPFGEDGTGTPAQAHFEIFEVNGIKCAFVICADAGIQNIRQELASRGVRLVLVPTGAGGKREDRVTNEELKTRAGKERKGMHAFWKAYSSRDANRLCSQLN